MTDTRLQITTHETSAVAGNDQATVDAAAVHQLHTALVAVGVDPNAFARGFRGKTLLKQWRDGGRSIQSVIELAEAMARVNKALRLPGAFNPPANDEGEM